MSKDKCANINKSTEITQTSTQKYFVMHLFLLLVLNDKITVTINSYCFWIKKPDEEMCIPATSQRCPDAKVTSKVTMDLEDMVSY